MRNRLIQWKIIYIGYYYYLSLMSLHTLKNGEFLKLRKKMNCRCSLTEKRPNFSILTLHTNIASASRCVQMWEYVYLCTHMYPCICMHEKCQVEFPW